MRMFDPRQILLENDQIIVVYKPAGIAVQNHSVGQMDLEHQLLGYLSAKSRGRELPYLAVVHRLDQPVEGILLFAKTRKAAADCSRQVQDGSMKKEYLAVVQPIPEKKSGQLTDFLLKDGRSNTSSAVPEGTAGAKRSELSYRVLEENAQGQALVQVQLMTGRHHQIRVQLSHAGMPIVGDRKYGAASGQDGEKGRQEELLLCAASLTFRNPATGKQETIRIVPKGKGFQEFRQVK